jgi:hypothetical protein
MFLFRDGLDNELLPFFQFLVNAISYDIERIERGEAIVESTIGGNRIFSAVDLFLIGVSNR